ncbi:MAG: 3-oxoacid CoA-transferase subunit B [Deltaproteobacteria bacterium]|nr:3-oxoacid CoA-transferase subunit B [Deltaproteobacteria bacterium]
MSDDKIVIAKRIAKELKDGDVVNLGIGLPTLVANYLPDGVDIFLESENGMLGVGPAPEKGKEDPDLINAGGAFITARRASSYFDSATSFGIIRGGHVDAAVLGALEVDEAGNLASHKVPGKMIPGMGGAMDLVTGAKKIIIATLHTNNGKPKILKKLTLPVTGVKVVDIIVTEKAVIEVTPEGLLLKEIVNGTTVDEVKACTEANLIISPDLRQFDLAAA